MGLKYLITQELEKTIKKQKKKDLPTFIALYKKITEIINSDEDSIQHYKNLRAPLNEYKRVHINKSFVLIFSFDKNSKKLVFHELTHHDQAYKKRLF